MVFLVNKKLICIAFLALSSVDVTFAQDSAAPIEEEAPTAMPILSGVSTPTEAPTEMAILNGDVDENGCIPSAGYSWCPSLEECIRSFETDCPSAAPKGPTPSPTSAPVNPAAQPTAKPTNVSSSAAALSSTKMIQQYHIAVVATLAAASVVVALVL